MAVLKTTSPVRSTGAPKLLPSKTVPSSRARTAGFNWADPPGFGGNFYFTTSQGWFAALGARGFSYPSNAADYDMQRSGVPNSAARSWMPRFNREDHTIEPTVPENARSRSRMLTEWLRNTAKRCWQSMKGKSRKPLQLSEICGKPAELRMDVIVDSSGHADRRLDSGELRSSS